MDDTYDGEQPEVDSGAVEISPEELPCDVCRQGSWDDDNAILICDGTCNRAVHQTCYGILQIPVGDWRCDACLCAYKGPCFLCRRSGGIMRQARGGEWVHVLCALTISGVHFANVTLMKDRKSVV